MHFLCVCEWGMHAHTHVCVCFCVWLLCATSGVLRITSPLQANTTPRKAVLAPRNSASMENAASVCQIHWCLPRELAGDLSLKEGLDLRALNSCVQHGLGLV